jgi:hypothetical protein
LSAHRQQLHVPIITYSSLTTRSAPKNAILESHLYESTLLFETFDNAGGSYCPANLLFPLVGNAWMDAVSEHVATQILAIQP